MIVTLLIVGAFLIGLYTGNKVGWVKGFDDGITEADEIASINRRREFGRLWTNAMDLLDTPIDDVGKRKELKLLFDAELTKNHESNI